ncbi:MAG: hypothetical protein ACOCZ6_05205 [Nanoarchaeota archaeon]
MKVRDRIINALQEGVKSNKELQKLIPDKSTRIISATISNNPSVFIRLDKALVGLKGRDEDKVSGNRIRNSKFCLYKKLVNILQTGEKSLDEIYALLPDEKKVSIRATVNMMPELFMRVSRGVIGRRGRDEHLVKKYKERLESTKIVRPKEKQISEYIEELLQNEAMSLEDICLRVPFPKRSVTSKLSSNPKFERIGGGYWRLKS